MKEINENTALSILFANTKRKRRQVDLITIAESCGNLAHLYGSQAAVAKRVGLSSEMIRQFMSLLKLPEQVKNLVSTRKIDRLDVAYRIAMLKEPEKQVAAAKSIANLPSSKDVRDVVRLVTRGGSSVEESARRVMEAKPKGLHIFVIDFDDKTYETLGEKAKDLGISPPELVKQLVEEWLKQEGQKENKGLKPK
jgi:hypothetical protein